MIIETADAMEVGPEAFKRKQSDVKLLKASDYKIQIIEKQAEVPPYSNVSAEVAKEPRQAPWVSYAWTVGA